MNSTMVRSSSSSRSRESASFFLNGFFNETKENVPEIKQEDQLLRFYEHCNKWLTEVDNGDKEKEEKHAFENSKAFTDLVARVSKKVGIDMKLKDVILLWEICR